MPSALETLVKILKLERDQAYKNTAVIGGLSAFSQKWTQDAHAQAKKPEHHLLVDELVNLLTKYEQVESKSERHTMVTYMLDRIMGRIPPPPEYQVKPGVDESSMPPKPEEKPPDERRPERDRHQQKVKEKEPPRLREPQAQKPRPPVERGRAQERVPHKPETKSPPMPRHKSGDDGGEEPGEYQQEGLVGLVFDEEHFSSSDEFIPARGHGGSKVAELDIPSQPRLARPPRKPRSQLDPEAASDILRGLNQPITRIRGIGARMAETLEKVGIQTINDLLFYLPRRYDDYTRLLPIRQ